MTCLFLRLHRPKNVARYAYVFWPVHSKKYPAQSVSLIFLQFLNRQNTDFNYLTETDVIHHFEFQSTDISSSDCRRFRSYEATLSMKTGKTVVTHVIYSSNARHHISEFPDGINIYKMDPISLQDKNAENILEQITEKTENGIPLEKDDIISLILLPIMGGTMGNAARISSSLSLLKEKEVRCLTNTEKEQVQALIYAFAEKFLSGSELENIREVMRMTRLGQMLVEEGRAKGHEEGRAEGIRIFIEDNMEEGIDMGRILLKLQNKFGLDAKKAQEYFSQYAK